MIPDTKPLFAATDAYAPFESYDSKEKDHHPPPVPEVAHAGFILVAFCLILFVIMRLRKRGLR